MRVFLTGADGFVGRYLLRYFERSGHSVSGISRRKSDATQVQQCDVLDTDRLTSVLRSLEPDWIVHLAGVSNIADSQRAETQTHEINYLGTLSLLQAMGQCAKAARLLFVSSAHIYAASDEPIDELGELGPTSPYATSKIAAEFLCREYSAKGVSIVIARPFNHIGPGQDTRFFVPSIMHQVLLARQRADSILQLKVGNIDIYRDFLAVEDVCEAYAVLLGKGEKGGIYNVASGKGVMLRHFIEYIGKTYKLDIRISQELSRIRQGDTTSIVGDSKKLQALGWHPKVAIETVLENWLTPSVAPKCPT